MNYTIIALLKRSAHKRKLKGVLDGFIWEKVPPLAEMFGVFLHLFSGLTQRNATLLCLPRWESRTVAVSGETQ